MSLFMRQDAQIASTRDSLVGFVDNASLAATMETGAATVADDLNNLRSALHQIVKLQSGNWYDDLAVPATFTGEGEAQRGVDSLNTDLHELERKRFLVLRKLLVDVTVGGTDDFVILGTGELPSNTTAAVGAVTTQGTVVAFHAGTFGTHSLDEVAGAHALAPKNLCEITDAGGDPILSGGRRVWGLLQTETATDGHTITDTTTTRAQISFVRPNAAHTDLEACPAADIQGQTIRYCYPEREGFADLTEQDFAARGASIDIGAGAGTVDRQTAYDNQGTTPVDLTTNAFLDLEGAGLTWRIRDDLEANLLSVIEGSAGGTSEIEFGADVDTFDNDAAVNDFASGATVNSGGTRPIAVGVTDGVIESTAGDLRVNAAGEMFFDDVNQTGSTWAQTDGIKLSETTAEWDAFESQFGEVSLLNAIRQAAAGERDRVNSTFTANVTANNDINGPGTAHANVDTDLLAYDVAGIGSLEVFFNGELMWLTRDYVAGGTPADGDLQLTFDARGTGSNPDSLTVIRNGANA